MKKSQEKIIPALARDLLAEALTVCLQEATAFARQKLAEAMKNFEAKYPNNLQSQRQGSTLLRKILDTIQKECDQEE